MDSLGKRTFDAVIAAPDLAAAIGALGEHALAHVLDHTEVAPAEVAMLIHGLCLIEAGRRYKLDNLDPDFP